MATQLMDVVLIGGLLVGGYFVFKGCIGNDESGVKKDCYGLFQDSGNNGNDNSDDGTEPGLCDTVTCTGTKVCDPTTGQCVSDSSNGDNGNNPSTCKSKYNGSCNSECSGGCNKSNCKNCLDACGKDCNSGGGSSGGSTSNVNCNDGVACGTRCSKGWCTSYRKCCNKNNHPGGCAKCGVGGSGGGTNCPDLCRRKECSTYISKCGKSGCSGCSCANLCNQAACGTWKAHCGGTCSHCGSGGSSGGGSKGCNNDVTKCPVCKGTNQYRVCKSNGSCACNTYGASLPFGAGYPTSFEQARSRYYDIPIAIQTY